MKYERAARFLGVSFDPVSLWYREVDRRTNTGSPGTLPRFEEIVIAIY